MDKITLRYATAVQTLVTLKESLDALSTKKFSEDFRDIFRDSVIKRFSYTIVAFWKYIQIYLQKRLQVPLKVVTPYALMHAALDTHLISSDEYETMIKGIVCRNGISELYDQDLAEQAVCVIPSFYEVMHTILKRIELD